MMCDIYILCLFFFSSRRRHTRFDCDWSSDVCSSDLKDQELAAEDTARRRFDKFWQQEEAWIRKGVEARRTRNEGRVRRLEQLRIERAARRDRLGNIRLTLNAGERSGELVAEFDRGRDRKSVVGGEEWRSRW